MFSKSKIFLISCLTYIFGTALASFLSVKFLQYEIWWFGATIFFLILTVLFCRYGKPGEQTLVRLVFLFTVILFFAIWRYSISLPVKAPDKIWYYNQTAGQTGDQTVVVQGFIANEPDVRETSQKIEIETESLCSANGVKLDFCQNVSGKILLTTDLYPEYQYGDELEIDCGLKQPEEFSGFAYDRYLARYDIYSVCYYPKITLLTSADHLAYGVHENKKRWRWKKLFYKKIFVFKKVMTGLIDIGLSEPESSLARPIVFGGQRGLEQSVRDDFQKVGLTHIMAVSGFNISILAAIVMIVLLALGLSRGQAFYLAVAILAAYIILVGLPASAMRAGLMGFLVLWALKLGRLNKMTNSLVLTAAVLLIINPKLLRDDVGFQLSFLAIAGLVYAYPVLEAIGQKIKLPKFKGLSDALLITLAAQVFTLPILAYNFSRISLIAPLANLAVLWTLPVLTVLILIALPLSFILPGLSFIFFLPSLILTKYILATVNFFAGFKYSNLEIDYLSWGWVVLYYFLAIFLVIKLRRSKLLKEQINGKI